MSTEVITAEEWNKRQARRNGARLAQASGRMFENALEGAHDYYRWANVADVFRLPVPTQPMPKSWLRDPRQFGTARMLASRQRADYFGAFGPEAGPRLHGRAIAMEAKHYSERVASMLILRDNQKGAGLKIHQLEALVDGWRRFGIVGVVVWGNGLAGNLFDRAERGVLLPPALEAALFGFRVKGATRIPFAECTFYDRRSDGPSGERWLEPVIAFMRAATPALLTRRGDREGSTARPTRPADPGHQFSPVLGGRFLHGDPSDGTKDVPRVRS